MRKVWADYLQPNGILKNRLGITEAATLQKIEYATATAIIPQSLSSARLSSIDRTSNWRAKIDQWVFAR